MKKITVAIADDHEAMRKRIADTISASGQFSVVGQACDGLEACELVRTKWPDVLLLDLIMPKLDGIGVLERLRSEQKPGKCPRIIVISAVNREQIIREALEKGAIYYFIKPFDPEILAGRICAVAQNKRCTVGSGNIVVGESGVYLMQGQCAQEVADIFHELGIPAHLNGYHYLKDAIVMSLVDWGGKRASMGKLYSEIAAKYHIMAGQVERSMRHAIEVGWERGNTDVIDGLFRYTVQCDRGRPTNSEFIALLVDKLRMEVMR